MLESLGTIKKLALSELQKASNMEAVSLWYSTHLGKSSQLIKSLRNVGNMPPKDRPIIGKHANEIRNTLEKAYKDRIDDLTKVIQSSIN